ncbi:hypothetical protein CASFOL_031754 [Castilleja foliolosa]|uniref:Uncharacterized protein n=1 Tax=Castilleja foliolosa TaxID=1961234 RepID=A0ABD3C5L9_9LAMI
MENWVLVEEADYKSTSELCCKMGDEKTLDNFIPKSESDFTEYAELVAHKLRPYEKSHHYIGLLKAVMRLLMVSLKGSDAKDVVLSITAIASEKIKVEKVQEVEKANARKKKKTEDEPVPSFLKKDYKLKFLCDGPFFNPFVGEADYKSTAELFGKMGDEKTLDNFIPKSESDFTEYAELVAHKLRPYEEKLSLKGSDARDVFSCLNDDMIIRSYEDEPVTSFLKKDNKRESTWDDADMDDRFIWPVEPDFASDEELIVPNKAVGNTNSNQNDEQIVEQDWSSDEELIEPNEAVGNTNSNQNDEQIVEQDWSSDEELIGPNEAFGNTNSNQLSETITKIDWNLWPEYRVWFSEEEIGPNDEVVEDTNSYQHNNLVQLDPEVWLEEQEKVWEENRLQVTNDDMNLPCFL